MQNFEEKAFKGKGRGQAVLFRCRGFLHTPKLSDKLTADTSMDCLSQNKAISIAAFRYCIQNWWFQSNLKGWSVLSASFKHFKHWQKYLTALTERQRLEVYLREMAPQPSNWALNTRCLYPGLSCMKQYIIKRRWTYLISRDTDRSHKIVYSQAGGTSCGLSSHPTRSGIQQQPHLTTFPCSSPLVNDKWLHSYEKINIPNAQQEVRHHRTSPCLHQTWNTALTQSLPINLHLPGPLSLSHFVWLGDLIKKNAMCRYGNLQWT